MYLRYVIFDSNSNDSKYSCVIRYEYSSIQTAVSKSNIGQKKQLHSDEIYEYICLNDLEEGVTVKNICLRSNKVFQSGKTTHV